MRSTNTRKQLI